MLPDVIATACSPASCLHRPCRLSHDETYEAVVADGFNFPATHSPRCEPQRQVVGAKIMNAGIANTTRLLICRPLSDNCTPPPPPLLGPHCSYPAAQQDRAKCILSARKRQHAACHGAALPGHTTTQAGAQLA
ncbi:hypothetical protein CRV24_004112 [Beauveria bassiana]|nr:hypothetical protein CRV24_004112 [Beauveria bassiana]